MTDAEFAAELRKWWSFNDRQGHTHSWHCREDFINIVLPKLLERVRYDLRAALQEIVITDPPATSMDWFAEWKNLVFRLKGIARRALEGSQRVSHVTATGKKLASVRGR
jgi:hypothetical protein